MSTLQDRDPSRGRHRCPCRPTIGDWNCGSADATQAGISAGRTGQHRPGQARFSTAPSLAINGRAPSDQVKVVGEALKGPWTWVGVAAAQTGAIVGQRAGRCCHAWLYRPPHRRGNPDASFEDNQRIPTTCHHNPHRAAIRQRHAFLG
jgi:hypothetical protein